MNEHDWLTAYSVAAAEAYARAAVRRRRQRHLEWLAAATAGAVAALALRRC